MKKIFLQAVIYSAFAFVCACAILPLHASAQSYFFQSDLTIDSEGADVVALQSFLVSKGFLVMPAGAEMGYFDALITRSAVAAYQASKGISPARGYFGPVTRASVNADSSDTTTRGSTSRVAGCAPGALFSSTTGASCSGTTSSVAGCAPGALFSATTGASCTGTISVTSPQINVVSQNNNENYQANDTVSIRWTVSGAVATDKVVMIALINKNNNQLFVDTPTQGYCSNVGGCVSIFNGNFNYKIPNAIAPGDYYFKILCSDKNSEGSNCTAAAGQSGYFKINLSNQGYVFQKNLSVGSFDQEVSKLKLFLRSKGYVGIWSPSDISSDNNSFWKADGVSLASYQTAVGISPANGEFNAVTRAKVNAELSSSSGCESGQIYSSTTGASCRNTTTTPTAALTATAGGRISTSSEITIHYGELVTYAWSSTNANQASSVYTSSCKVPVTTNSGDYTKVENTDKADCGSGNWFATTTSGTYTASLTAQSEYNYILTYTAKNSSTGQTATAVLKVHLLAAATPLAGVACDAGFGLCLNTKRTLIADEYRCILNRVGEESGVTHFAEVPAGVHFIDILATFFNSSEWLNKNTTNEAYVYKLYKCVLNRNTPDPTPVEINYWVSIINSGSNRNAVLAAFVASPEYKNGMGAQLSAKFGW